MRGAAVLGIVGFFCVVFSLSLLPPLLVSLWYQDGEVPHFALAFAIIIISGMSLWLPLKDPRAELHRRDGFLVVALFWTILSLFGALPFIFGPHLHLVDALFESASGFTTTGATVMTGLDHLPRSVLFYRQELQWFGGMGLIVLAVAVLPILGIGGMELYRAEAPGPMKEEKLTPRLKSTARALWALYVGLTVACAIAYWFAGMTPFDAVSHSLATISTGGFSTHDASLGYFASPTIETVAIFFMLAGGINFSIHFLVWRDLDLLHYLRDVEVRAFLAICAALVIIITLTLYLTGFYTDPATALRDASFETISVITSTGFGSADFSLWPLFVPVLLIFSSFIGGCGGSTAGGMKVMRFVILAKQGYRESKRLMHPHALFLVKAGGAVVHTRTAQTIWGFFSVYTATFVILLLMMMLAGLDQVSAFSAVATCMNNLGPGLGEVAYSFATLSDTAKLVAVAAMLLGRLEVFTILVLLLPEYWRE